MDVSIVVETFNFGDDQGTGQLSGAIAAAQRAVDRHEDWELVVVDTCAAPGLEELASGRVRIVDASGLAYDGAKVRAAGAARGRYVVYLDGDCEPLSDAWAERLVDRLRAGPVAAAGITLYRGGWIQAACTVLDFGFLFDALESKELGCYSSNNVAFLREAYLETPVPQGGMRCHCFAHAQQLVRKGTPVVLVPESRVLHEPAPFFRERIRRGYDLVAACWADPELYETRWLRKGIFAAPRFYRSNLRIDRRRLSAMRRFLGWSTAKTVAIAALLPILRLVDLVGIVRALREGSPRRHGVSEPLAGP